MYGHLARAAFRAAPRMVRRSWMSTPGRRRISRRVAQRSALGGAAYRATRSKRGRTTKHYSKRARAKYLKPAPSKKHIVPHSCFVSMDNSYPAREVDHLHLRHSPMAVVHLKQTFADCDDANRPQPIIFSLNDALCPNIGMVNEARKFTGDAPDLFVPANVAQYFTYSPYTLNQHTVPPGDRNFQVPADLKYNDATGYTVAGNDSGIFGDQHTEEHPIVFPSMTSKVLHYDTSVRCTFAPTKADVKAFVIVFSLTQEGKGLGHSVYHHCQTNGSSELDPRFFKTHHKKTINLKTTGSTSYNIDNNLPELSGYTLEHEPSLRRVTLKFNSKRIVRTHDAALASCAAQWHNSALPEGYFLLVTTDRFRTRVEFDTDDSDTFDTLRQDHYRMSVVTCKFEVKTRFKKFSCDFNTLPVYRPDIQNPVIRTRFDSRSQLLARDLRQNQFPFITKKPFYYTVPGYTHSVIDNRVQQLWYDDNNRPIFTNGTQTGAVLTNSTDIDLRSPRFVQHINHVVDIAEGQDKYEDQHGHFDSTDLGGPADVPVLGPQPNLE